MPSLLEHQLVSFCFSFSFFCLSKFDVGIENLWNILFQKFDMFLWTSGFQNPLVHTDFDMFVDE